jgi:hypothetical protein
MWLVFLSGFVSGLIVLFFMGRFNERAVSRRWEALASDRTGAAWRAKRDQLEGEIQLADVAYDEALQVRELGSTEEAIELLDAGYLAIERFAPNLERFLKGMGVWSRMVSAMAPVKPLRPLDFKVSQLVSLAYLNQLLHHFLVTTKERFRLRIYVLVRALQTLTRFLFDTTRRIDRNRTKDAVDREWRQLDAIRTDLRTVVDKSLESYQVLLASLLAERQSIEVSWSRED